MNLVWVDAPDPSFCGYQTSGGNARCCLNGVIDRRIRGRQFRNGDEKKAENERLWNESVNRRLPYYKGEYYHEKS